MAAGEVFGLKNGELVMAGVLGGDYNDRMTNDDMLSYRRADDVGNVSVDGIVT